jgi:predicted aldo/keto reductase-like oxidoreductase
MKYRDFKGEQISQLGFGAMRLPTTGGFGGEIDFAKTEEMLLYAYEHGVNYFDSAYVYHNGKSEEVIGEVFKKNNFRDKINIATKLPTMMHFAEGHFMENFEEQLRRLQTDHIDFYLIHGIDLARWKTLKENKILDFIDKLANSDKVRYLGFSFHDEYDSLVSILGDYDWNFAQIQLNFIDAEYQAGVKGLEYAASKNVPLTIMEPLRGGRLINISGPEVDEIKSEFGYEKPTIAKACFDWLFDKEGILTVLSGMNKLSDVVENIESASEVGIGEQPQSEKDLLIKIKAYIESFDTIPCTSCRYCVPECPNDIEIPAWLNAYNETLVYKNKDMARMMSSRMPTGPNDCVECGNCAAVCPQHLEIPELLKKTKELLAL